MLNRTSIRLYGFLVAGLILTAAPASAQFIRRSVNDPATGEQYHIEGTADFWKPDATMSVSVSGGGPLSGVGGTTVDFKNDLGLTNQRFRELRLVLRPARKHKFRFQYIPITFHQHATVTRDIAFNGQRYRVGLPVESLIDWKAYRFTYEYDFVSLNRGFGGFLLEAKYTDFLAELDSPTATNPSIHEYAHARGPIPAIGGIVRVYVVPNVSITGELSGIKTPLIQNKYQAHYADLDVYGTFNLTRNVGAQLGFRTFDIGAIVKDDSGSFVLKGLYFGVVARHTKNGEMGRWGDGEMERWKDGQMEPILTSPHYPICIFSHLQFLQPSVSLGKRFIFLAETEPQLRSARCPVAVEAAAGNGRHADVFHEILRKLHII